MSLHPGNSGLLIRAVRWLETGVLIWVVGRPDSGAVDRGCRAAYSSPFMRSAELESLTDIRLFRETFDDGGAF